MSKKDTPSRSKKASRVTRTIRAISISALVLLVLFVGAGLAYTYLGGPENATPKAETEEKTESYAAPFGGPSTPAKDANVSASVQALTSPVASGENASLSIRTLQAAECTIVVEYDDVKSDDSGLSLKVADEYGIVSWVWTVEETVPEGEWPVEVTCSRNGKSAMVRAYLEVALDESTAQ